MFLDGFEVGHEVSDDLEVRVQFDYGDLDLLVVRANASGYPLAVTIEP